MGLNGEGWLAEGWAVPYIGDGLKATVALRARDGQPRNVDPEGRQQFRVRGEVDRGHQQASANAAAASWCRSNRKSVAKHPAGAAHVAGCDQLTDRGARHDQAMNLDSLMDSDSKSKLIAEFR